MRKIVYATGAALLLAACTSTGPMRLLWKPGASERTKLLALDQCRISSFKEIPQTMVSETHGGYHNPGTLQCSTVGGITNCYRVGAVNIPARTSTYDANDALRNRYMDRCLMAKGYQIITLPRCKTDSERRQSTAAVAAGQKPSCTYGDGWR